MKRTITPGARTGRVRIPASKSQAHRLLICAALGEEKTEVVCDGISADIAATAKCLSALGAKIEEMETGFLVSPIKKVPEGRCGNRPSMWNTASASKTPVSGRRNRRVEPLS